MATVYIIVLHLICFTASFYALSCVKFENFTNVRQVQKVRLLLLLLAIGLGYIVAQFLLVITYYH